MRHLEAAHASQPPNTGGGRLPYLPALDGLRAVAVIAVLLYHANLAWIPGGFLGVEMFFVISGYLITSLLLSEWKEHGSINFKVFWLRRARRLLPALFLLLFVVVGVAVAFLPNEVAALRGDVFSTAGYVNNWYQIFSHKSYFESVGRPSLLRHMWSLAVEEQFYVLWPLLLSLLLPWIRRGWAMALILAGAVASGLAMALLFQPNADPSRVYYGTDTRAAGLLLGAVLAWLWPPKEEVVESRTWVPDAIGFAAFGTVLACFGIINEFLPFLYRGGFTLCDIATAELVAVAVHPRARLLPRLLAWAPLRWVGLRSYGIYLWHFPVFMLTRPQLDWPVDGLPLLLIRFALTGLIAALSYDWIETPIRQGALGLAWARYRQAVGRERVWLNWQWGAGSAAVVVVGVALGVLLATAKTPAPPDYLAKAAQPQTSHLPAAKRSPHSGSGSSAAGASAAKASDSKASVKIAHKGQGGAAGTNQAPAAEPAINAPIKPVVSPPTSNLWVTAIGDSVLEGVADELRQRLGTNVLVNADQGRLPWNTPAVVRDLHLAGKIYPVVVLHIGNNGFFSAEVFGRIMAELKDARRVVVVNVKVPRRWESVNNRMLASEIKAYPNAVLVDWNRSSTAQPKVFWGDGIHVRPAGASVYADLVTRAIWGS